MATCAVSGNIVDPAGAVVASVSVIARVPQPVVYGNSLIAPFETSAAVDASGNFVITVQQSISVIFTVQYPIVGTESMRVFNYTGNIPATTTASFVNCLVVE